MKSGKSTPRALSTQARKLNIPHKCVKRSATLLRQSQQKQLLLDAARPFLQRHTARRAAGSTHSLSSNTLMSSSVLCLSRLSCRPNNASSDVLLYALGRLASLNPRSYPFCSKRRRADGSVHSLRAMILDSISRASPGTRCRADLTLKKAQQRLAPGPVFSEPNGLHDESLASCQTILRDPEGEAASSR